MVEEQPARAGSAPFWITTAALQDAATPSVEWIARGLLSEGLGILVGRQKIGKSQLALNLAIGVATGGVVLGEFDCGSPADVLYGDAELGQRRVKARLAELFPSRGNAPDLTRLSWAPPGSLPELDRGLLDRLDLWRTAMPRPRLVVLDVWQAFAPTKRSKVLNAYESESNALRQVAAWANAHHIGVLLVHHTKKGEAVDPLEMASGSNAMTSVPNTAMILNERAGLVSLYVRGHDVEQRDFALGSAGGWWRVAGDAADVMRSAARRAILDAIREGAVTPGDIASATGRSTGTVRQRLFHMRAAGEVVLADGRYGLPSREPLRNAQADSTGKTVDPEWVERGAVTGVTDNGEGEKEKFLSLGERFPPSQAVAASVSPPSAANPDFPPPLSVTPVTALSEDLDGAGLPGPAAPGADEKVTADDVLSVIGTDLPDDAMVLLRWLANRDDAGTWVSNTAALYSSSLKAAALKAVSPALAAAGHLAIDDLPGEAGKTARHYRVTDTALSSLAAARRHRIEQEAAVRAAAEPQLSFLAG